MSEAFQYLDILILAVIAGLVLLRLRSVLGRRTGHEKTDTSRFTYEEPQKNKEEDVSGNINISINHNAALNPEKIETVIKLAINEPILDKIKSFLEQSGYTYMLFDSFNDDNIEFKEITFLSMIEIKKNIHLKNYLACLSGVFTVLDGDLSGKSEEIKLKYKRVSNYNQMDSIDSFINEMRKKGEESDLIRRQLVGNFGLTEEVARQKYADWASQVATETDLFENRRITIRTNTGFPVSITRNKANFSTRITISNINDIGYLRHVFIYTLLLFITIYFSFISLIFNF